jgi:hypothetical protein
MKRVMFISLVLLPVNAARGYGQQCGGRGATYAICSNGAGCNMQYISQVPGRFDPVYQDYTITCCGKQVRAFVPTGVSCEVASLKPREKNAMELLLGLRYRSDVQGLSWSNHDIRVTCSSNGTW